MIGNRLDGEDVKWWRCVGREVLIPVMDWTTGSTLGSQAGEYEGREDGGVGMKRSTQMEVQGR